MVLLFSHLLTLTQRILVLQSTSVDLYFNNLMSLLQRPELVRILRWSRRKPSRDSNALLPPWPPSFASHFSLYSFSFLFSHFMQQVCLLRESCGLLFLSLWLVYIHNFLPPASSPFPPLNPSTFSLSRLLWGLYEPQSLEGNMITYSWQGQEWPWKQERGLEGAKTHSSDSDVHRYLQKHVRLHWPFSLHKNMERQGQVLLSLCSTKDGSHGSERLTYPRSQKQQNTSSYWMAPPRKF